MDVLAGTIARIEPLVESFRQAAIEVIAAPGGAFVLAAGIIGVLVLAVDSVRFFARILRRHRKRADPLPTPAGRARGLAKLGANPAEIARAVGLSRDALALVIPDELSRGSRQVSAGHRIGGRP